MDRTHQSVALALITCGTSAAGALPVEWVGLGADPFWTVPGNWNAGIIPCNTESLAFDVTVPPGQGEIQFFAQVDQVFDCELDSFDLGASSILRISQDSSLTIHGGCGIAGEIHVVDGDFIADGPGVAFLGTRARVSVSSPTEGSSATMRVAAATYSSTDIWHVDGGPTVSTYTWDLMSATGPGSLLDLSSLQSIDAGFDSGWDNNHQKISASNGGVVDLSGVVALTSPYDVNDRIEVNVDGAGSIIDFELLQYINSASKGTMHINAINDSVIHFPSLESISSVVFAVDAGGQIHVNGSDAMYSSTDIWHVDAGPSVSTYTWDLMSATGPGSLLDLSSLQSIDAGFNSGWDNNHQKISASNGGVIDLSGVVALTSPYDPNDRLGFDARDGGVIDLSTLSRIHSASSGRITIGVHTGATVTLGEVVNAAPTTFEIQDDDTVFRLGSLVSASGWVWFSINETRPTIEIAGSLTLKDNIFITSPAGFEMSLGGDLCFDHTEEPNMELERVVLRCDGQGTLESPQVIEAGGLNAGCSIEILEDANFGFGRLIIGDTDQPTVVQLDDSLGNGNDQFGPEALYLYGMPGADGLDINTGSTLVLNGIDVYVMEGGYDSPVNCVHLNTLFGPGETEIAYGGGTVRLEGVLDPCPADMNDDGLLDLTDIVLFVTAFLAQDPAADLSPPVCLHDLNDVTTFIVLFQAGCP